MVWRNCAFDIGNGLSLLPTTPSPLSLSLLLVNESIKRIGITAVLAMFSPIYPSIFFKGHLKLPMTAADRIQRGVNRLIVDLRL